MKTSPVVSLQVVTAESLPLLTEILNELDQDVTHRMSIEEVTRVFTASQAYPYYRCYFGVHNGLVIGSLSLLIFPIFAHGGASEAIVEAVVVRPSYRNQGYGRALLHAAVTEAAQQGCYKLALSSNLRRLDAHRFYAGIGFEQHGYSFSIQPSTT